MLFMDTKVIGCLHRVSPQEVQEEIWMTSEIKYFGQSKLVLKELLNLAFDCIVWDLPITLVCKVVVDRYIKANLLLKWVSKGMYLFTDI